MGVAPRNLKMSNVAAEDLNKKVSADVVVGNVVDMDKSWVKGKLSGNLNRERSCFKPYKRCSMDAKEGTTPQGDEKGGCKRLRLEGEAAAR